MISRLLKTVGLFCKRALLKRLYSATETYNVKEPTNRSHPILKRPMKETNKRERQKRPSNEIFKRDLSKRSVKETYEKDPQKRLIKETYKRDPLKRLIKETYKRDP